MVTIWKLRISLILFWGGDGQGIRTSNEVFSLSSTLCTIPNGNSFWLFQKWFSYTLLNRFYLCTLKGFSQVVIQMPFLNRKEGFIEGLRNFALFLFLGDSSHLSSASTKLSYFSPIAVILDHRSHQYHYHFSSPYSSCNYIPCLCMSPALQMWRSCFALELKQCLLREWMTAMHALRAYRPSRIIRKSQEGNDSQGHTVGWIGPPYQAPCLPPSRSHNLTSSFR